MTTSDVFWEGSSGDWFDSAHWNTGVIPGAADDTNIDAPGSYTVTLTAPATMASLTIAAFSATLDIADLGGTETIAGGLSNSGIVEVDAASQGGTTVLIGGALTNDGRFTIGNGMLSAATTVSAADLTNTGTITIEGGSAAQAGLIVNGSAPATWVGELDISGNGLLQFASGGITAIDSGASINLLGPHARVALSGAPSSNSALAGLASNDGQLELLGGFLTTTTDFLNSGTLLLDDTTGGAGGAITFGGTLNNSGFVQVGNAGMTASTALTAAGLGNIGSIVLTGSSANDMAIMTVNGDASNDGSIDIGSFADLQIAAALSGLGDVTLEAHSTLELGGTSDSTVTFDGIGAKLKLDDPTLFTGTLSNFGLDDVLNFGTFTVDAATLLGSTLDITIGGDDYFYAVDGVPDGSALAIVDGGHGVELMGPADRWTVGVDGSWFDGSNWSTGQAPQAGEHAIIDAPGFYTVTLDGQAEVDDLDLASSGVTLRLPNFESRLTVDGTLTVASGTLDLEGLGTIAGGVIANVGGSFLFNQGRLDGVTIEGTLDLSGEAANLSVTNGITLLGAGGVGDGDVELTGAGAYLRVEGDTTLDNALIDIGNLNQATLDTLGTLTLGPNLDLHTVGVAVIRGDALVNEGTIEATGGSLFIVETAEFDNAGRLVVDQPSESAHEFAQIAPALGSNEVGGSITVEGGAFLDLGPGFGSFDQPFMNFGTIDVSTDFSSTGTPSTLALGDSTRSFFNDGSITVASANLELYGADTPSGLNYAGGGSLAITDSNVLVIVLTPVTLGSRFTDFLDGYTGQNDSLGFSVELGGRLTVDTAMPGGVSIFGISVFDGTVELAVPYADTIAFGGGPTAAPSTVKLDDPAFFTGTLVGLRFGDTLDFGAATVSAANIDGSTLDITVDGTAYHYATFNLPQDSTLQITGGGHEVVLANGANAPPPAQPSKFYLLIDGMNGGSTDAGHNGWFDISGYDLDVSNILSGGATRSEATFSPVTVAAPIDSALGSLLLDTANGSRHRRRLPNSCSSQCLPILIAGHSGK